ncbi:MAG: RNA methyltransferase [Desulfovibrio sp.]|nr:RNA methyltransferase [Desulfovibrio sp.]
MGTQNRMKPGQKNIVSDHSDQTPLLPGLKPVLELLASEPGRIDHVFCKKSLRIHEAQKVQTLCRRNGVRFTLVEQAALDNLCREAGGHDNVAHQGIVARLSFTNFHELEHVLTSVTDAPLPVILALDQVQDPGNVGTLARTLYTLGGAGIILPRHNSAYLGSAARRASAGALEHLPVAKVTNLGHALDTAEETGLTIYGAGSSVASNAPRLLDAFMSPLRLPAVLVLGNEDKGLRPGVAKRCAHMLRIPQARPFDSLNVAQAGAILLGLTAARLRASTSSVV